jgi:hypothetical protein
VRGTLGGLAACACVTLLAVAGCGARAGAGSPPTWAASLGSGVTVEAPALKPVSGSPQAVVTAYVHALDSGNFAGACGYVVPSYQAACKSAVAENGDQLAMPPGPAYHGFTVGYTLIDGGQALVGATGQLCVQTQAQTCVGNSDPAAVLDSGKSFAALWARALQAQSGAYSPIPCVEVNGAWYLDTPGV